MTNSPTASPAKAPAVKSPHAKSLLVAPRARSTGNSKFKPVVAPLEGFSSQGGFSSHHHMSSVYQDSSHDTFQQVNSARSVVSNTGGGRNTEGGGNTSRHSVLTAGRKSHNQSPTDGDSAPADAAALAAAAVVSEPSDVNISIVTVSPRKGRLELPSSNVSTIEDIFQFMSVRELRTIKQLDLSNNQINQLSLLLLKEHVPQLKHLNLSGNSLKGALDPNMLPLTLKSLNLSHNELTDVVAVVSCTELEILNVSWNELADIVALPTQLISLDLSNNKLADTFISRTITTCCHHLKSLSIYGNPLTSSISSSSVMSFSSSSNFSSSASSSLRIYMTSQMKHLQIYDGIPLPVSRLRNHTHGGSSSGGHQSGIASVSGTPRVGTAAGTSTAVNTHTPAAALSNNDLINLLTNNEFEEEEPEDEKIKLLKKLQQETNDRKRLEMYAVKREKDAAKKKLQLDEIKANANKTCTKEKLNTEKLDYLMTRLTKKPESHSNKSPTSHSSKSPETRGSKEKLNTGQVDYLIERLTRNTRNPQQTASHKISTASNGKYVPASAVTSRSSSSSSMSSRGKPQQPMYQPSGQSLSRHSSQSQLPTSPSGRSSSLSRSGSMSGSSPTRRLTAGAATAVRATDDINKSIREADELTDRMTSTLTQACALLIYVFWMAEQDSLTPELITYFQRYVDETEYKDIHTLVQSEQFTAVLEKYRETSRLQSFKTLRAEESAFFIVIERLETQLNQLFSTAASHAADSGSGDSLRAIVTSVMQSPHGVSVAKSVAARSDYIYKPFKPAAQMSESAAVMSSKSRNQEEDYPRVSAPVVTAGSPAASKMVAQPSVPLLSPLLSNMNSDIDALQNSYMAAGSAGSKTFTAGATTVPALSLLIAADSDTARSAYNKYASPTAATALTKSPVKLPSRRSSSRRHSLTPRSHGSSPRSTHSSPRLQPNNSTNNNHSQKLAAQTPEHEDVTMTAKDRLMARLKREKLAVDSSAAAVSGSTSHTAASVDTAHMTSSPSVANTATVRRRSLNQSPLSSRRYSNAGATTTAAASASDSSKFSPRSTGSSPRSARSAHNTPSQQQPSNKSPKITSAGRQTKTTPNQQQQQQQFEDIPVNAVMTAKDRLRARLRKDTTRD